jgi:hypothetical protein
MVPGYGKGGGGRGVSRACEPCDASLHREAMNGAMSRARPRRCTRCRDSRPWTDSGAGFYETCPERFWTEPWSVRPRLPNRGKLIISHNLQREHVLRWRLKSLLASRDRIAASGGMSWCCNASSQMQTCSGLFCTVPRARCHRSHPKAAYGTSVCTGASHEKWGRRLSLGVSIAASPHQTKRYR